MGLSAEQGAADVASYVEKGVTNGTRENGTKTWTEEMDNCAEYGVYAFCENRMPGVVVDYATRTCDLKDGVDRAVVADEAWTASGNANVYPLTVGFTPEETAELNKLESAGLCELHDSEAHYGQGRADRGKLCGLSGTAGISGYAENTGDQTGGL